MLDLRLGDAVHARQGERAAALVQLRLHRERLEQAVVGEDAAHFAAALQVGLVLGEQALDFLPFRRRLALVVEQRLAGGFVDVGFLHADQPVLLLDLVQRDLGHAEREAPRVGRHVDAARPAAAVVVQVLARGHAEHGDRRVDLAAGRRGEDDRVLARHRRRTRCS